MFYCSYLVLKKFLPHNQSIVEIMPRKYQSKIWTFTFYCTTKNTEQLQNTWPLHLCMSVCFEDDFFFLWLLFEEAFIKAMKLSVSILEADSVHLFHLQLFFFSQWNTRIEVYTVYRWAVSVFRFFDLFCWSVMITGTSIWGSIHQGHEPFSEHF